MSIPAQDDEIEYVPIPMDARTRRWLVALAQDAHHSNPAQLAGAILRDVAVDDELECAIESAESLGIH